MPLYIVNFDNVLNWKFPLWWNKVGWVGAVWILKVVPLINLPSGPREFSESPTRSIRMIRRIELLLQQN